MGVALDGFALEPRTFEGETKDVYRTGSGPAVIVVHEMPGITPNVADFGRTVAAAGFTAGSSLAVGPAAQGSVAGKVTSINGASFVLGPSIGVGLYELQHSLPYLTAGAACAILLVFALFSFARMPRAPDRPGRVDEEREPDHHEADEAGRG